LPMTGVQDVQDRGNLLWESSRFVLSEHRAALAARKERQRAFRLPELHEDRLEQIERAVVQSLRRGLPVALTYAGAYGPERYEGRVTRIDAGVRRLWLEGEEGVRVLRFERILDAEAASASP
ncbi:MAG: YolD-like family protein, partial [Clostridia bacterium]|nr:YolD-like family protein [Clostridia bacterium]